jgi:AraC-like DNA-binding protein
VFMYILYPVCSILAPYIDCFWESDFQEAENGLYKELYVAQFNPNVIFNLAKSYQRNSNTEEGSTAVTVNTAPILFTHKRDNQLFGIRFKTGALRLFTPLAMHELADEVPTVNDLFGDKVVMLETKIQDCTTTTERIAVAETFLIQYFDPQKLEKYQLALHIQHHIQLHCTQIDCVQTVVKKTFLTQRSMDRYFQEYLGLSPKKMSRLVRFEQSFAALHQDKNEFNLYDFGYYDQAHYSKEFKVFCGLSPTEYLKSVHFVQNLQAQH